MIDLSALTCDKSACKKSKRKIKFVKLPDPKTGGRIVYFVIDVEVTGALRAQDRIIEMGSLAVAAADGNSVEGTVLGTFNQQINNDGKSFAAKVKELLSGRLVNPISEFMLLRSKPKFDVVGQQFIDWMSGHLGPNDVGVLVAHNGAVDFQFLAIELLRLKGSLKLPPQVKHTLDTYAHAPSIEAYKQVKGQWKLLGFCFSLNFSSQQFCCFSFLMSR